MDVLYKELVPCRATPESTGIFSDLDGTISAMASTPDKAFITPQMRDSIEKLSHIYKTVAVVTGRDAINAKQLVEIDSVTYIGNHGLERLQGDSLTVMPGAGRYIEIADKVAAELAMKVNEPGVIIEKKKLGVAVHFRLVDDKVKMRERVTKAATSIAKGYPLKLSNGRNVVELKPELDYNKGDAVRALATENRLKCAIYLGDDLTDVDAFKALKRMRDEGTIDIAINVAVASEESDPEVSRQADFVVAGVEEVQKLLGWLAT